MAAKIRDIAIKDIEAGERLRAADGAWVGALMDSIRDNGLLQPLVVRPIRKVGKRPFELLAGMHRLAACQSLNWSEVSCLVLEVDDQEALLAQIDENIARHELNVLDRAVALVERQDIYEALHPETKAGVAGAMAKHGSATDKLSFADDAADKTGLSPRSVQRATKLVKGLKPEKRTRLAGTYLADNQAALTQISTLGADEPAGVLDRMLRAENPMGKVSDALADFEGRALGRERTPAEKQMASLIHNWNRARVKVRRDFIRLIKETDFGEIEFDTERYGEAP